MARWPSMTSVYTSGSGPSSRTEPTSTNGLSALTIEYIKPSVTAPAATAPAMLP